MTEEKSYTLRELEGDDMFLMIQILSKIGVERIRKCMSASSIRAAVQTMLNKDMDEKTKEETMNSISVAIMLELTSTILERLPDCKTEIYTLLAQVSGKDYDEIAHMKLIPLTRMLKDFFRKPEFPDFFTEVYELLN